MNKFLIIGVMGLLLVGCVSAYYCIQETDNNEVKQFKSNINILALKQDIMKHNLTKEAFELKMKYFSPCR